MRVVYNDMLNKMLGIYNEKGAIEVKVLSQAKQYDYLNLTAAGRVLGLDKHFEIIQNVMKQQLNIDSFDEFGLPVLDVQRLIGRIININSSEDPKLNESNIGLINLNDDNGGNLNKMKLQLSEVESYSFFEGEIVVVEGILDQNSTRINVSRIHKP